MLYLLNAPIAHTPDLRYVTTRISRECAIQIAAVAKASDTLVSAIGHDGSAQVLSVLLDQPVAVNRVSMSYQPGDTAICLQLRTRQPEGVVLTAEQVEAIGYDLTLIETSPAPVLVIFGSAVAAVQQMAAGEATKVRKPGDIDVIYGGMDGQEARSRVDAWARSAGLIHGGVAYILDLDLHPELCSFSGPSYTGHEDLGTRQDFPARFEVKIPHPSGMVLPDTITLCGKPAIKGLPVNSLAATIRRCAAERLTALQAGDQIAKFIANTRNGSCIILRMDRGEDASYLETSVAGIRSAWAKLLNALGETHGERMKAHDTVTSHVDGYLLGVGSLLGRIVTGVSAAALQRLRFETMSKHGVLEIRRQPGAENIWQAGAGEVWDTAGVVARWLGDMSYCDPTKTFTV